MMIFAHRVPVLICAGTLAACAGAPGAIGVGGYQAFTGTLDSGETFAGVAWYDARTDRNAFCSRLGAVSCRASFPPAGEDGYAPIPFTCDNGLTGTSRTEGAVEFGSFVASTSWIELSDGSIGAVEYGPAQVWNGEDLCGG